MIGELQAGDPQAVGPYRVLGRLGAGGMGQVYLGRSVGGRLVAVKVIRPELTDEPGFRARFAREVAAARNVSGLFTALVVDADVDGPVPWLATAYVAGPSLAEAVETHGPLPAGSVLTLAAGLAEGLQAIHAARVVHRDLKPSNVLLADDGPRVIDFGISRAAEASMLTQSGMVVGSPGFMSPEQANGGAVGLPSDVFSLGAVLTFAATGAGPFGTGSSPALLYRVVHQEPDLTRLPAQIRPLIERCLAKDPGQRPATGDVLAELGSAELAGDWLPASITEVLGRYTPPAADDPKWPSTMTSAKARRIPTDASARAQADPLRRRHRRIGRRPASLLAAAGLIAAAASMLVLVPRADGRSVTPPPSGLHATARDHASTATPGSVPPPAEAKLASRTSSRARPSAHGAATQAAPANQGAPANQDATQPAPATSPPASRPSDSPSTPPAPTTGIVPGVLYTTLSAATSALEARGFHNIPYLYGCYGSRDIGDVVRQSPGAGTRTSLTAPVQLYLQANNCDTVPNVIGMSLSDAAYTLKAAGFTNIPYLYDCDGSPNIGDVVSQSPAPGTSYGSTQPVSLKLQANNC
jgi:serine/threonine protein kinase